MATSNINMTSASSRKDQPLEHVRLGLESTSLATQPDLNRFAPPVHAVKHYGDTHALVLDHYVLHKGVPPRTVVARYSNSVPLVDYRDGRGHRAWLVEKRRRLRAYTKMLERDDYSSKRPASCAPAWAVFKAYRPYKVLFGERLHCSNYPSIENTAKKPIFDLPGELRNTIYQLCLDLDAPIELLPKSAKSTNKGAEIALRQATRRYHKLRLALRFLRTNRQINQEASDMFYGDNVFRFTGIKGWFRLRGFLTTIGRANAGRLRSLVVHVPWKSSGCDDKSDVPLIGAGPGLRTEEGDVAISSGETHRRCIALLEELGQLSSLTLVLPWGLNVRNVVDLGLDGSKFKPNGLDITLVHLRRQWGDPRMMDESQTPLRKWDLSRPPDDPAVEEFADPESYAAEQRWAYELLHYDDLGAWPLANEDYHQRLMTGEFDDHGPSGW